MNVRFCNRRTGAAIAIAALAVLFTTPAAAGPIQLGVFQEFAFSTAGTPATGCDPADPAGPFCIPSGGTPTSFLTAPPWTFVAPGQGAVLIVTDAFDAGDRFQVFDFGISLGLTSVPIGNGDCGDDPVVCLANRRHQQGQFQPRGRQSFDHHHSHARARRRRFGISARGRGSRTRHLDAVRFRLDCRGAIPSAGALPATAPF